jgi:hypothetical protein
MIKESVAAKIIHSRRPGLGKFPYSQLHLYMDEI